MLANDHAPEDIAAIFTSGKADNQIISPMFAYWGDWKLNRRLFQSDFLRPLPGPIDRRCFQGQFNYLISLISPVKNQLDSSIKLINNRRTFLSIFHLPSRRRFPVDL
jgi:hypothetical protein